MQQEQSENVEKKSSEKELQQIFASHLPPRSEYHKRKQEEEIEPEEEAPRRVNRKKQQRVTWIKILAFIFLLLPIIIGSIFFYREINRPVNQIDKDDGSFEQVDIDQ